MASQFKDQIPGGLADKKKPSDFKKKQLLKGIKVEFEHTGDREIAKEIAMDHLTEDPVYYDKLETIEKHSSLRRRTASRYLKKLTAKLKAPFMYPSAAEGNAQPEVKEAVERFRELPYEERSKLPLLWWLLGATGTPPYKTPPLERAYVDESPYENNCDNCQHMYYHPASDTYICDQISGVIQPEGWCQVWKAPFDTEKYKEYQKVKLMDESE